MEQVALPALADHMTPALGAAVAPAAREALEAGAMAPDTLGEVPIEVADPDKAALDNGGHDSEQTAP